MMGPDDFFVLEYRFPAKSESKTSRHRKASTLMLFSRAGGMIFALFLREKLAEDSQVDASASRSVSIQCPDQKRGGFTRETSCLSRSNNSKVRARIFLVVTLPTLAASLAKLRGTHRGP
jgi:hypothetical protein